MPLNEKLDLRTDARWFKSFGREGRSSFACSSISSIRQTVGVLSHELIADLGEDDVPCCRGRLV